MAWALMSVVMLHAQSKVYMTKEIFNYFFRIH